jgi:hypothetical protein
MNFRNSKASLSFGENKRQSIRSSPRTPLAQITEVPKERDIPKFKNGNTNF